MAVAAVVGRTEYARLVALRLPVQHEAAASTVLASGIAGVADSAGIADSAGMSILPRLFLFSVNAKALVSVTHVLAWTTGHTHSKGLEDFFFS